MDYNSRISYVKSHFINHFKRLILAHVALMSSVIKVYGSALWLYSYYYVDKF
jgi:hypothetical protein